MRAREYLEQLNRDDSITIEIGDTESHPLNTYGTSLIALIIPSTFSGTELSVKGALSGHRVRNKKGVSNVIRKFKP